MAKQSLRHQNNHKRRQFRIAQRNSARGGMPGIGRVRQGGKTGLSETGHPSIEGTGAPALVVGACRKPPVMLMNFHNPAKEDLEDCADATLLQSCCSSKSRRHDHSILFCRATGTCSLSPRARERGCGVIVIMGDHRHAERCSRAAFLPPAEAVQDDPLSGSGRWRVG